MSMPVRAEGAKSDAGDEGRDGGYCHEVYGARVRGHGAPARAGDDIQDPGDHQRDRHHGDRVHVFFCM